MTKREVLEKVYCDGQVSGAGSTAQTNYKDMDEALVALDKLEKEKILRMVGEDLPPNLHPDKDNDTDMFHYGANRTKAEIRKKVRGL